MDNQSEVQPNHQPEMRPGNQTDVQPNMQSGAQQNLQPGFQPGYRPGAPLRPVLKSPKQPMDKAKKKKIILFSSIGAGLVVIGILAAVLVPTFLRVDYAEAYKIAKELKPKIYDIYKSYDCEYVDNYLTSTGISSKKYSEYVDACIKVYGEDVETLVVNLGNTAGVNRNEDIKKQFDRFKAQFDATVPNDIDELRSKTALWQAFHDFTLALNELSYGKSSDADFEAAANYLIKSGNDTLKEYGEGWLERALVVSSAQRVVDAAGLNSWSTAYNEYRNKLSELKEWMSENQPNLSSLASLGLENTYNMYEEFESLYEMIADTYELNYNSGSGDCTEFLGEVYCE